MFRRVLKNIKLLILVGILGGFLLSSCGSSGGMLAHKSCQANKVGNHRY